LFPLPRFPLPLFLFLYPAFRYLQRKTGKQTEFISSALPEKQKAIIHRQFLYLGFSDYFIAVATISIGFERVKVVLEGNLKKRFLSFLLFWHF
jgi:hypothetical protein